MNYEQLESAHLDSIRDLTSLLRGEAETELLEKLGSLSFYTFLISAQASYVSMFTLFVDEMMFCETPIPGFTLDSDLAKANLESFANSFQFDFANPNMKPFIVWYNLQIRRYENFLSVSTRNHSERDVEVINFVAVQGTQQLRSIMTDYLTGLATMQIIQSLGSSVQANDPSLLASISAKVNGEDEEEPTPLILDDDGDYN